MHKRKHWNHKHMHMILEINEGTDRKATVPLPCVSWWAHTKQSWSSSQLIDLHLRWTSGPEEVDRLHIAAYKTCHWQNTCYTVLHFSFIYILSWWGLSSVVLISIGHIGPGIPTSLADLITPEFIRRYPSTPAWQGITWCTTLPGTGTDS